MSQLQGYLIPVGVSIAIKAGDAIFDILLNFTENFPHTTARCRHWMYLLSDANLDYWNLQQMFLLALLPMYLLYFWRGLEDRHPGSWSPEGALVDIEEALVCTFALSKCYSIFVIFYIGWSVPPGGSKLMTWIDLWLESFLTAAVAWILYLIPIALSSLAYGWENFLMDVWLFFQPRLHGPE